MEGLDVSVVIPAYNQPELLLDAVESIYRQDYGGTREVIVVDDESPRDLRGPLLERFPEVRYFRKSNGGTSAARQYGCERARGRFVAFLDHDDLWLPEMMRRQAELFERHVEVQWVVCDAVKFAGTQNFAKTLYQTFPHFRSVEPKPLADTPNGYALPESEAMLSLLVQSLFPVYPSTLMMRREFLERIGGWDGELRAWGEDQELMMRAFLAGRGAYLDEPLVRLRRHHGANQSDDILQHNCRCQKGLEIAFKKYPPAMKKKFGRLLGLRLNNIGWMAYQQRQFGLAFEYYSRALRRGVIQPGAMAKWLLAGLRATTGR